jgi:hypothetical protein
MLAEYFLRIAFAVNKMGKNARMGAVNEVRCNNTITSVLLTK